MCDLAWVTVSGRVRAVALADRPAYLSAGEDPPDPEARVSELHALLHEPLAGESMTPQMRRLRALLGV